MIRLFQLWTLLALPSPAFASSWTEVHKLVASDGGADASFGIATAISGDRILVGALYADVGAATNAGEAYVFARSGSSWIEEARLTAFDAAANDEYGTGVTLVGDTAVIGSPRTNGVGGDSGAVYVYTRSGATWTLQQKIVPVDSAAGDAFGRAVALEGDTLVVGADGDDEGGVDSGSAYVFVRVGTTWTQQAKLIATDGQAGDSAGRSVALSNDTAIVSAHEDDDNGGGSGAAYAWVRSGSTWTQHWKFSPSAPGNNDRFGRSVAIVGETAVMSAYQHDEGAVDAGAAYVFVRSGSSWTEEQRIVPADAIANGNFAKPIVLALDLLIVGGVRDDDLGIDSGSVYVYSRSGTTWTLEQKLHASDGGPNDLFGTSVSVQGSTLVIGAAKDDAPLHASGSVYTFELGSVSTSFCFGDGTGNACPCGNFGAAAHGCANSVAASGALLVASGTASLAIDSVTLQGSGMPNSSALYFQGTVQQAGGLGSTFGDGLRCTAGSVVRLGTKSNVAGASQFPSGGDLTVSAKGLVLAPGTRHYQVWYRNAATFCTSSTFNLSNGVTITWSL